MKVRKLLDEDGCLVEFFDANETIRYIAHLKYKRCLAMAESCMHKRWRNDEEGYDYARSNKQMHKWLELAEKFKEGK